MQSLQIRLKYEVKNSLEQSITSLICIHVLLQVFIGNSDTDTVVKHPLTPPIKARYVRLTPTAWSGHISMRMELYGCLGN